MAGITLAQAQARLDAALQAADAFKGGKEVAFGDRRMVYHDLDQINRDIEFWNNQVKRLSETAAGRGRSRTIRPGW